MTEQDKQDQILRENRIYELEAMVDTARHYGDDADEEISEELSQLRKARNRYNREWKKQQLADLKAASLVAAEEFAAADTVWCIAPDDEYTAFYCVSKELLNEFLNDRDPSEFYQTPRPPMDALIQDEWPLMFVGIDKRVPPHIAATVVAQPLQVRTTTRATTDQMLIEGWIRLQASGNTRATYAKGAAQFLEFIGGKPLGTIAIEDLVDYREHLIAHYRPHAAKTKFNVVKSLLSFGAKTHYLPFNVAAAVKAPVANESLHERILSEDEVKAVIGAAANDRDRAIITLLYTTGGRVSEVADIRWGDIRPSKKAAVITVTGKGDRQRSIVVKRETYNSLLVNKPGWATNEDPVFASRRGGDALSRQQIWRIVKEAAELVGIPNASPHWFRHSHISHALEAGANPALVQKSAGHKSLEMTGRYAHVNPDEGSALYLSI